MIYVIEFGAFEDIVCRDLTADQIKGVQAIVNSMSRDAYAGYSLDEQAKCLAVHKIIGHKKFQHITHISRK